MPAGCYPVCMTTVEIEFRYAAQPTEQVAAALGCVRDVYGIRRLALDRAAATLRVEFDATRLTPAAVSKLVRETGLEIEPEPPRDEAAAALPAPAATA